MIEAKHNRLYREIFNLYINNQLKKHFNNFYLYGEIPVISNLNSLLVLPNHFSWWDGFFVDLIYRKYFSSYKIKMMVLEETIKRYWFFNRIGAFSINTASPKDILNSFSYVKKILNEKENFVVIFPQGELNPYSTDVKIKPGIRDLILNDKSNFGIIFLSMKIQFGNTKKPDVYFRLSGVEEAYSYVLKPEKLQEDFTENLVLLEKEIKSSPKIEIKI